MKFCEPQVQNHSVVPAWARLLFWPPSRLSCAYLISMVVVTLRYTTYSQQKIARIPDHASTDHVVGAWHQCNNGEGAWLGGVTQTWHTMRERDLEVWHKCNAPLKASYQLDSSWQELPRREERCIMRECRFTGVQRRCVFSRRLSKVCKRMVCSLHLASTIKYPVIHSLGSHFQKVHRRFGNNGCPVRWS
jgi:hypothetical protein